MTLLQKHFSVADGGDFILRADHNHTTGALSERLALLYGYSNETARQIRLAAILHDIGKSRIPKSILDKPGKLTKDEYEIVKLHTVYGFMLMKTMLGVISEISQNVTLYHHERYDGRGYWGIKGEQQPMYVKIVTLADVYTALISERVYKPAWTFDEAIGYIRDNAGLQFDPHIVEIFLPIARDFDFTGLEART